MAGGNIKKMSKILITGAAGFIGSQLAYRLYKDKEDILLVDNFSYGREDNLIFDDCSFTDTIYRKDIRDREFMEKLFADNKFDIIYHFAGITPLPDCQNEAHEAVDVNVSGTVLILELAKKYGVGKVIFASTSAVYENNTEFPLVEDKVTQPSLIYPSTKYSAEQFCKAFYDAYKIPICILRFTNVYGPHIDCLRTQPPVMGYIIREFYNGRSPILHSDGKQERDFIYVDDLLDLAIKVQKNEGFDIVNVSTAKTISINEIAKIIAEEMNTTDIEIKYRDVSKFWSNYPKLYEAPYPIDSKILEHEVLKYTCLSNEHAKIKYEWIPKTDIKEGIRKTIEFTCKVLKDAEKR